MQIGHKIAGSSRSGIQNPVYNRALSLITKQQYISSSHTLSVVFAFWGPPDSFLIESEQFYGLYKIAGNLILAL